MSRPPTALVSAVGLVGGFAAARYTNNRRIGGSIWAAAGLLCLPRWACRGAARALLLSGAYAGAMGLSHPLARKIGAWPSVAVVTAGMGALCSLAADRDAGGRA